MATSPSEYSAEEIAQLGDAIYAQELRSKVEKNNIGKVIAIDVQSHNFVIDDNALLASQKLLHQHPNAEIWCIRIGYEALHHIGMGNTRPQQ